jgi:arabinogalactan oligomer/maltooligosaccharide transport system permease protein
LYLIPAFAVMAIITFYPMGYQVWMSFTDYGVKSLNPNSKTYQAPNVVGVQNYSDIFKGDLAKKVPNFDFWKLLTFNLVWTFTNVPVHVVLGVLIAVLLNTPGLWFKRAYRAIYILPIVIPTLVVATVWKNLFDPQSGGINKLLATAFGPLIRVGQGMGLFQNADLDTFFRIRWFDQIDAPFFADAKLPIASFWIVVAVAVVVGLVLIRLRVPYSTPICLALGALVLGYGIIALEMPLSYYAMLIANIWLGWPFMTIVATGALQSIPLDLYEAASIDGASPRQQFVAITVPLLRPAIIPAAMLGVITTFNLFNFVYMMSAGGPIRKTEIMVTTAYTLVRGNQLYGVAAAFCVIIFFVLLGLTLLTNGITRGTERYDV